MVDPAEELLEVLQPEGVAETLVTEEEIPPKAVTPLFNSLLNSPSR